MPSIAAQNPKSDENSHRIRPTYAYATLITRDSYLEGVQCLKRSLSRVNSIYPLIVMFTPDSLSPDAVACLQGEGCILYPVTRYLPHKEFEYSYKCPEYAECWTKLQLWKLDQYFHRLMYLDADMVVMKNIDNLFTDLSHKHFYAVPDCAFGRTTEEERNNCSMGAYLKCTNDDAPNSLYFNAGFFLMTPSIGQFCEFEKILESTSCPAIIKGYAEQDFLNHYFQVCSFITATFVDFFCCSSWK